MPAWGSPHDAQGDVGWKLVLFIRELRQSAPAERAQQQETAESARYVGSAACAKCHAEIYAHWKKTPMANVVRDPSTHPDAIVPDLRTNPIKQVYKEQVALVYGSVWKQRYSRRSGMTIFRSQPQWDVTHKVWRPYFVANGTDWWATLLSAGQYAEAHGPTCDGCHSVDYNIHTKQVAEWNVGCERCHGPGSEHLAHPTRTNILDPARMDYVRASDTCIQCHSQGGR